MLAFAARHHLSRRGDERVRTELACSPTRYVQLLTALLDRPEAAEVKPEMVAGLQALRGCRQRLRASGRGR